MQWVALIAAEMIVVTGLDGQPIDINPDQIVSTRPARITDHAPGARCVINTTDAHFYVVKELCSSVQKFMEDTKKIEGKP